ncbi:MAG TPA: hypothetical protein VH985_10085 [Candidatus Binatia bacterium]
MLAMQTEIGLRDRGPDRSCRQVRALLGVAAFGRFVDTAVDDDRRDVDILRLRLAGHALGQPGRAHLSPGKSR